MALMRRKVTMLLFTMRPYSNKFGNIEIAQVHPSLYEEVLNHVTPIFLRDEPLSKCFPPCTTGCREQAFRKYATKLLTSGLSIMAIDGNRVIGAALNRPVHKDEIMNEQPPPEPDADPLMSGVESLLTIVHRELDLFTKLSIDRIFDMGIMSVERPYASQGIATLMLKAGLALGVQDGLKAVKGDATGPVAVKVCTKVGMVPIYKLPYKNFKVNNKVVFQNTDSALTVFAAKLQENEPYTVPISLKF